MNSKQFLSLFSLLCVWQLDLEMQERAFAEEVRPQTVQTCSVEDTPTAPDTSVPKPNQTDAA